MADPVTEHYAREAERLLRDETLARAFNDVRLAALARLADLDPRPENIDEIRRQQAIANCLPEVLDALQAMILATGKMSGGVHPERADR